uniref:Prokineticin domain-containing protein n=1 Tax=Magallana gigas TaxID=29159 RepID=A0A8W8KG71_MAGGI
MNLLACGLVLLFVVLEFDCIQGQCCDSDNDCPQYNCCVHSVRGRRAIGCGSGTCTRFGAPGEKCHVGHHVTCPCLSGLTCVGTGEFEFPQGEIGVCQRYHYG